MSWCSGYSVILGVIVLLGVTKESIDTVRLGVKDHTSLAAKVRPVSMPSCNLGLYLLTCKHLLLPEPILHAQLLDCGRAAVPVSASSTVHRL